MSYTSFLGLLKSWDLFGASIPSFNLQGKSNVNTIVGAITSIFIISMTFMFALIKFDHMMQKRGPSILQNTDKVEDDVFVDISSDDFMLATGLENYKTGKPLNDPRYIKWIVKFWIHDSKESSNFEYY